MIGLVLVLLALIFTVLALFGVAARYPLLAIAVLCLVLVHLLPSLSRSW